MRADIGHRERLRLAQRLLDARIPLKRIGQLQMWSKAVGKGKVYGRWVDEARNRRRKMYYSLQYMSTKTSIMYCLMQYISGGGNDNADAHESNLRQGDRNLP